MGVKGRGRATRKFVALLREPWYALGRDSHDEELRPGHGPVSVFDTFLKERHKFLKE